MHNGKLLRKTKEMDWKRRDFFDCYPDISSVSLKLKGSE